MLEEKIRYVAVWPAAIRATHWLLAAGLVFQLSSGWLGGRVVDDPDFWRDWHVMVGQALLLVLLVRLGLLFGRGTGHWRAFVPSRQQLAGARQTLVFYLSLGKAPLPNWYAHNPLWQLLYPLVLLLLLLAAVSGLLHDAPYLFAGASPARVHGLAAGLLAILAVAHVAAVFLHDLRAKGAFVSAMINGHRYFHVSIQPGAVHPPAGGQSVDVSFDSSAPRRPHAGD